MRRLQLGALVLYIVSLPFFWPELFVIPGTSKVVYLADVAFLVLLGSIAAAPRERLRQPMRPLFALASLPLAATTLSAGLNHAWAEGAPELLRVGYSLVVLVLLAHVRLEDSELGDVAKAWLWICTAVCAAGLLAWLAVAVLGWPPNRLAAASSSNLGPGFVRVTSFLNANALVLYIQTGLAFWTFLRLRRHSRPGAPSLLLALCAAAAILAYSRGLAGLLVQVALLAFTSRLAWPRLWRWRLAVAASAGLLAVAAAVATVWVVLPTSPGPAADGRLLDVDARPNAYFVLHSAGVRMFLARPVLGIGPQRFGSELRAFTTAEERTAAWPPVDTAIDWDPHSTWLGLAAETGVIGLASWLCLLGWVLLRLLRGGGALGLPQMAGFALVGLLLNGLHMNVLHLKLLWALLGLALGASAATRQDPGSTGPGGTRAGR